MIMIPGAVAGPFTLGLLFGTSQDAIGFAVACMVLVLLFPRAGCS